MGLAELKSEFHNLIDQTEDPGIIEQFFDAMSYSVKAEGTIWNSLTLEQQQGVLDAYDESRNDDTLITLDQMKAKYANWS